MENNTNNEKAMTATAIRTAVENLLHDIHVSVIEVGRHLDAYQSFLAKHKAGDKEEWAWFAEIAMEYGDFAEVFEDARDTFFEKPAAPSTNDIAVELERDRIKLTPRRKVSAKKDLAAAAFLNRALVDLRTATAGLQAYAGLVGLLVALGEMEEEHREFAQSPYYRLAEVEYHVKGLLKQFYPEAVNA